MKERTYVAIDLKSFYASVECRERGLDPMTTNLVVADISRTEKTICLAVSPTLKQYGISGRARLFEVIQRIKEVNAYRQRKAPRRKFSGASFDDPELKANPHLAVDYIAARPRMALYIDYSTRIYDIYLNYFSPEDIHVYSIDEVFIDMTHYLRTYRQTARELTKKIILEIIEKTGISATAGIGTNLYLCKVAMDIQAKHIPADPDGVRIAELDEMSYRRLLWNHRPITDFWRVGKGYAKKLEKHGLFTMGDIARCSIGKLSDFQNEGLLYKLFGINAELLIDHAWGWEPCTMEDIKSYKPRTKSTGSGQVLQQAYSFDKAKLVAKEMSDNLSLDLVDKKFVTDQIVLTVGYDRESLTNPQIRSKYRGEITVDAYGRSIPKSAHGTVNLGRYTSSASRIIDGVTDLFDRIVDKNLLVRRINVTANHILGEGQAMDENHFEQLDLFTNYEEVQKQKAHEEVELEREKKMQEAMLEIKRKYGKNAVVKGMNLEEGATALDRNKQIGGHKA